MVTGACKFFRNNLETIIRIVAPLKQESAVYLDWAKAV